MRLPLVESEYAIPMSALARFFFTQYESGVQNIQLSIARAAQTMDPSGSQVVHCDQAYFTYTFANNQFVSLVSTSLGVRLAYDISYRYG